MTTLEGRDQEWFTSEKEDTEKGQTLRRQMEEETVQGQVEGQTGARDGPSFSFRSPSTQA